jgi:N utilization substance protein A
VVFVTNAISPAKVQRVSIVDDGERIVEVIVEDKQLSLAIGKKGQNVRLAAKLTGWKIDIKSEEEKRREVEAQFETLELPGDNASDETADGETVEASDASNGASEAEADAGEQVAAQADDSGEPADEVDAADAASEAAEDSAAETTRAER